MQRKTLHLSDLVFLVDTREQRPLDLNFDNLAETSKKLAVETVTLDTGDYSIRGLELAEAVVERKSLPDLLQCVGNDRDRFERELHRMLGFRARAVVVEASWDELMQGLWRSQLKPAHVIGSVVSWQTMGIPFFFHPSRDVCARYVRSFLWTHARHCWERVQNFSPGIKIENTQS